MTVQDLAVAFTFTEAAIAGVKPDQWADPTPCSEWNVRELVNHTIAALTIERFRVCRTIQIEPALR